MRFAWFVALRYLRQDRAQTALIFSAVAVGVTVIVFLSALIGGLQRSLLDRTLGTQPHIVLRNPDEAPRILRQSGPGQAVTRIVQKPSQRFRSIDQWPRVLKQARRTPGVLAAAPSIVGAGFATRGDARRPVVIRGVELEPFLSIVDVRRRLLDGELAISDVLVVIGSSLASDLGIAVGDKLHLSSSEGPADWAQVAGIFRLGTEAVDRTWVLTSLRRAQALYALPGGATSIELKVAEVFDAERTARDLQEQTGLSAESWMKLNAELLAGLSAQASSKSLIQFFVVVAVALGIASVLIVSVVQKAREIGILRAMGTPASRVLQVFLIQGGLLGLAGSIVGSGLGALFAKLFESIVLGPDGAPRFPVFLTTGLFLAAGLLATAVGLLAAVLPARRAAKLDPATAIRNV